MKKLIFLVLFMFMTVSVTYADDPVQISSTKLLTTYSKNELAADKQFKDKEIIVTGIVNEVGKDFSGDVYVSFKTPNPFDNNFPKDLNPMSSVQCYFDNTDDLENLSKGDKVSIQGECEGLRMLNVILKDCKLIK